MPSRPDRCREISDPQQQVRLAATQVREKRSAKELPRNGSASTSRRIICELPNAGGALIGLLCAMSGLPTSIHGANVAYGRRM